MSAYDFIKKTYTGTSDISETLQQHHHGIIVDNQSTSELSFITNSDETVRKIPASSVRGFEFTTPFGSFSTTASGYHEVHIFN